MLEPFKWATLLGISRQIPGLLFISTHTPSYRTASQHFVQTGFCVVHSLEFSKIRSQQHSVKDCKVNIFWRYEVTQLNRRLCVN